MQIIPTPHAANQFSHGGPFFQDIFRISLPGGRMWLTSAAFNTHLTSLFAGKNVQKIAFHRTPLLGLTQIQLLFMIKKTTTKTKT